MPDDARVHIDSVATQKFLRADNGPVGRYLMVAGERVKVKTKKSLKDGFPSDFLGPQLVKRIVRTQDGPTVRVGADHIKTKPHPIDAPDPSPGRPRPALRFQSNRGPAFFYTRHVDHPGSDFTKYLGDKLNDAVNDVAKDMAGDSEP
jgi:hypothetical protein